MQRNARWFFRVFPIIAFLLLTLYFLLPALPALAQVNTGLEFGTATGLSTQDIRVTVAKIIRAFLGLLGVIGIGVVLTGGFLWMTSGGEEEKISKAKKLLANGAIGLTIVLLSFSIAQFVLSRLNSALSGSGTVTTATDGGGVGTLPPGALPGGCADPGGATPFICGVSPSQGGVGSYVTIRGYRFGAYAAGASVVRIGSADAPIVSCGETANWNEHLIVVEVPSVDVGRSYPVTVATAGGASGNPVTFGVTADALGPQIACVTPSEGPEQTAVTIRGKLFGSAAGAAQFAGGVAATISSWADAVIEAIVPSGAQSGDVTVAQGERTSNGYPFTVTCATDADCTGGSCVEGQCVGVGDGGAGTDSAEGPVITSVSPQTLVSTADGTAYRKPEDVPEGTQTVIAPNGAVGNYISIRGSGFGATPGRVIFLGQEGATDDKAAQQAPCASAWSDAQAVVVVPEGAALGPIRIETASTPSRADQTDDAVGTAIEHFRPNATARPGICALTPSSGTIGAAVAVSGVQFGAARGADDAVLFGDLPSGSPSAWGATSVSTTVPNIAEGAVGVRVRAGGWFSNEVAFTREAAPRTPRIQEIVPNRGGPGQYATIRGEHFGSAVGKVTFTRGGDTYEVVPRFPDLCRQEWWRDDEITVRIPANAGEWGPPTPPSEFNAIGSYDVRVNVPQEGGSARASNAVSFAVTADQPSPGICALVPSSGPVRTLVSIIGERFGGAEGVIRFFDGIAVGDADRSEFRWRDGEVSGILVPQTARTGPVRLWPAGADPDAPAASNRGSNPVTFEVRDCRQGGTSACAEGSICCGNGTCVARAQDCGVGPTAGSYQWTFATGVVPKVPRVVEACTPTDASVIPSPSPWDAQGAGQEACVNANIAVRFTQSMALDPVAAASGVLVYRCGGGTNIAAGAGGFEGGALPPGTTVVDGEFLTASAETIAATAAHSGTGVLRLTKRASTASDQPRTTDLPRDAPVDRHYFAVAAPSTLITDTNGTTYTARVFVKGVNPNKNPNMRAGIVIGRAGGPKPADQGWWQQAANEVAMDGTWQELAVSITFDQGANKGAPGFVRLYVTGPPVGTPTNPDDRYAVDADDLEVVRSGDPCATQEEVDGLTFQVTDEGGRLQSTKNIITVAPFGGAWAPQTWYEVIVAGDGPNALMGAAAPRLRLDGDKDDVEGGNYRFRFRTRASAEACAVAEVAAVPGNAVATQRGPTAPAALIGKPNAVHPGLVHVRADGVSDAASCFTLSTSGMNIAWSAAQPGSPPPVPASGYASVDGDGKGRWCAIANDCAVVSCANDAACTGTGGTCDKRIGQCVATAFCAANRCNFTPQGAARNWFSNTVSARAHSETPLTDTGAPRPVAVRATIAAATPRTGESKVAVRFEKPRVTAVYPTAACQQACPNGRVAALVNVDLDPATVQAPSSNVQLYRCAQENCRRGEIVAVGGVTATSCASGLSDGACTGIRTGADPQIVMSGAALDPNTSYRVVIRGGANGVKSTWGVPLEGLNYAENDAGALDAYSWTFRTAGKPCDVARIDVFPNPVAFTVVGERLAVDAVPIGSSDSCSPGGQPLDAELLPWNWAIANQAGVVARFTSVTAAGTFPDPLNANAFTKTARISGPSCTRACVSPGSRRVPGICGNGVLEQPAEECEKVAGAFASWCDARTCLRKGAKSQADGGTCGNGIIDDGEECDKVGPDGQPSAAGAFSAWCDSDTCLNRGSVSGGSTCGNGNPATPVASAGDGEDCDDGNTDGGDGCSPRCLSEGTLQQFHPVEAPYGILARCGDGVVADGLGGRPDGGEECDLGSASRQQWEQGRCDDNRCVLLGTTSIAADPPGTCGNGTMQVGEQCDDGAVGTCNVASGNAGAACSGSGDCTTGISQCVGKRCNAVSKNADAQCATNAECTPGTPTCEGRASVDGDGCSSSCLLEGAAITWRNPKTGAAQPSLCGDGRVHTGESCDLGSASGESDPAQIMQAIGSAPADAEGAQSTVVGARVGGVEGSAEVVLQCGYSYDADECPSVTGFSGGIGVDRQGCCRPRPLIIERSPSNNATGVCRNAGIAVRFDRLMDTGSVGVVADLAAGSSTNKGAVLERETAAGVWEAVSVTPSFIEATDGSGAEARTVSELRFTLTRLLDSGTRYRVRVLGADADTAAQGVSVRSLDGVRFESTSAWTFTAGSEVCAINRVNVTPVSSLLQRLSSRANMRADAISRRAGRADEPIVSIPGSYAWTYQWGSSASDIATTDPTITGFTCGTSSQCAFKPAEPTKNGDALALATATVTANTIAPTCTAATAKDVCAAGQTCTGGHCVGESFIGKARLRALICENPWPSVAAGGTGAAAWDPFPAPSDTSDAAVALRAERISLAYCRDHGTLNVCRLPGVEEAEDAKTCAQDSDCASVPDAKCLPALRDDLPAFDGNIVLQSYAPTSGDGRDELRKEFFFLPRGVSYCSVSQERCDPTLDGFCPAGEFCRVGKDAIGLRLYENERHVGAARWFGDQGFTEATTPVDADGYRGVRSGRSVYVNAANTGSVYTNLSVLSVNDAAVPETTSILNQVLAELRFSTNLTDENVRACTAGRRCVKDGALCTTDAHCPGAENRCDLTLTFPCTADANCSRVADGATVNGGACVAPKDKLQRDTRRLEDLNEIRIAVEAYGRGQARCSVTAQSCKQNSDCPAGERCLAPSPELAAGTFIPGLTTSRWPSWAVELGKVLGAALPVDPLNVFGGACAADAEQNEDYDQQTCWNQEDGTYTAPTGSYLYEYRRMPAGTWEVRGGFEVVQTDELEPAAVGGQRLPATVRMIEGGVATQPMAVTERCGDGALASGEECDPPGKTEADVNTCDADTTTPGTQAGSRFRVCQQDCTWSSYGSCGSTCGNFKIDGAEQCDVGPGGGRVPAGHPTADVVPGVTHTSGRCSFFERGGSQRSCASVADCPPYSACLGAVTTQYACSATCQWDGGRCGDNTLQPAYGEQCDGTANIAQNPAQSSPSTQYACTPVSDTNPCKATGGFCGDGTVADAKGEQCEGSESRSCIAGAIQTLGGASLPRASSNNFRYASNAFTVRPQAANGSVRLTLVTSNDGADLSALTRDQIEAGGARAMSDYNPRGAQGGIGLYHRITVKICDQSGTRNCVAPRDPLWALASTTQQTNSIVIEGVPSGSRTLSIEWDNDWRNTTTTPTLDSNIRIHEVRLDGGQVRSCGDPGGATACKVLAVGGTTAQNESATGAAAAILGWGACRPVGALCGNGVKDDAAGEQCDDGGKGRCANAPLEVCASDADCGTTGGACDLDADACTSDCRTNVCGDGRQLSPTCAAGDAAKIGTPCTSNAACGTNGLCATEACDLGTSNWRSGTQCTTNDTRCVDKVTCAYGRTCNYCTTACRVATKQGGFCGDRAVNGTEKCDFVVGTNQDQAITSAAGLDWTKQVCAASCGSRCPDTYTEQDVIFTNPNANPASDVSSATFTANGAETWIAKVRSCRLFDGLTFDVDVGSGVNFWPTPISVVVVTDRSESMQLANAGDCNGDGRNSNNYGGPDARIVCVQRAIAGTGGLLDKLKEVAEARAASGGSAANLVKVGLVSYERAAQVKTDSDLTDIATQLVQLKAVVGGYKAMLGTGNNTYTGAALKRASEILAADMTARTKVIILTSDGAENGAASDTLDASIAANAFKRPNSNQYIFTIAFPTSPSLLDAWSSGNGFHFDGKNLASFYGEVVKMLAGATITFAQSGSSTPSPAVTFISRSASAQKIAADGFAESCASNGGPTNYQITVNFGPKSGAPPDTQTITLSNPKAQVCLGPPWKP